MEKQPVTPPAPRVSAPTKPVTNTTLAAVGLDPAALDRKADPCEDFYQFACGGWLQNVQIAPDLPEAMRSFIDIALRNEAYLHDVLEKYRTAPGDDPLQKQLGSFYGACMDEPAVEKLGTKPIAPLVAQIAKIKDAKSLSAVITTLSGHGMNPLFAFYETVDSGDATKMIAGIDQSGLTLPDRDYYLNNDDAAKEMRTAFLDYATSMLVEVGHKPDVAKREAADLLTLETEIAKVSKDKVAMRDPKGTYNKTDRAGVKKAMPHFDWDAFLKAHDLASFVDITVSAPDFLTGVDKLLTSTPAATWRNFVTLSLLGNTSAILTSRLEAIAFKLRQKIEGAAEQKARWKRCVAQTDRALGESLGQIFVRDRFPGASKTMIEEQVRAIVTAMRTNLDGLVWMDPTTRAKAQEKLAAMAYHLGYPEKWKTYAFKIDSKTFAANVLAARKEARARDLAKIGKPVDRNEWGMTTPTVNAYYDPSQNKMVFPAGILQTPFYQVDHGVAVNLGAIGMVIGHELTHGFDDQGAQYDAVGNLKNWWQPETEQRFKDRTRCVVDQYSKYPAGGRTVNGALTAGENIADIGGLKLALAAYRGLRATATDTLVADGFTEDQQFFLGFAQTWCDKLRPEYEASLVLTDPHSPAQWRVNGTLTATPEFGKAFSCKVGAKLRPANACVVW